MAALNYEPVAAGYRRLRGYEKTEGGMAISDAAYAKVSFSGGNTTLQALVPGALIRIWNSTNTTLVTPSIQLIASPVLTGGSYAAGTATGYIIVLAITRVPGAFDIATEPTTGAQIQTAAAVNIGVVAGGMWVVNDQTVGTQVQRDAWTAAAKTYRRQFVGQPAGTGPVRGVAFFDGGLLAIRDSSGQARFYSASTDPRTEGGWTQVPVNSLLAYNTGSSSLGYLPGGGVSGVTSGASAQVRKVYITSGTWLAGNAVGVLALSNVTGTFSAGENLTFIGAGVMTAKATSPQTTPTMTTGGRFEMIVHNFYGASNLRRVYGVNGLDQAFEYDGTVFVKIDTGMDLDTPNHIAEHNNALFLSFPGGSVQFSQPGEPTVFNPVVGAGEIGVGADVTNFLSVPDALAITTDQSVRVLYGSDASDYQMKTLNPDAGALTGTAQRVFNGVYLDNGGLRSLAATQQFGNFTMGSLSQLVAPLLEDYRRDGVSPVCSMTVRSRDQYWLFFDNQTGLVVYLGRKDPEILPFRLDINVTCCASAVIDGIERTFLGAEDGFVYEMDKGADFDGNPVEHYLRLPFNHFGAPQVLKRAHKVSIDMEAGGTTTLSVAVDLDYGAQVGTTPQELVVTTGGGAIDGLGSNEAYYASQIETVAEAYLGVVGKTVSLKVSGETTGEQPHTLTGVTYHVSPRGLRR